MFFSVILFLTTLFFYQKPDSFTELYFENHLKLPREVVLGRSYPFKFTIHNLNNKAMSYSYEVKADKLIIDKGTVSLKMDGYKTISEKLEINKSVGKEQVIVSINKGQQIHFWVQSY